MERKTIIIDFADMLSETSQSLVNPSSNLFNSFKEILLTVSSNNSETAISAALELETQFRNEAIKFFKQNNDKQQIQSIADHIAKVVTDLIKFARENKLVVVAEDFSSLRAKASTNALFHGAKIIFRQRTRKLIQGDKYDWHAVLAAKSWGGGFDDFGNSN
jgi:hypothetical protein